MIKPPDATDADVPTDAPNDAPTNAPTNADAAALLPLRCPHCGGEVPFCPAATVACLHCGEQVPIPDEHRQAAEAAQQRDEHNSAAAAVWQTIAVGGTPRPILTLIKICALIAGVSVLFPGLPLMAAAAQRGRYVLPFLIWFGVVELVFLLYAVLVVQATSRSVAASTFWSSLGASPVEGMPGSYRCRSCAALLNVPAAAVAVNCAYCGRDNLVGLSPGRLQQLLGQARHSTLSLEAASKSVQFRRDERKLYFFTQVLLAQLVLLPMLARGLDGALELGRVGPLVAFGVTFAALLVVGFAVSMRTINAHLKQALAMWQDNDEQAEAYIMGQDYLLVVTGDAGVLLDSPMTKAFVPTGSVERARFAGAQFDITWREGGKQRASFNAMGDKSRLAQWVRETSGDDVVQMIDGDAVSKARAVFNALAALAILAWIAGMIFL
jgi:hypothetical protein